LITELQRLLVRLDSRAAQGALEQRSDKLHDECVVGGRRLGHGDSPFASVIASRGYTIKFITIYGILCLHRKEAPLWPLYGSLTCSPAPQSSWI
jgi:hypothetical protein